MARVVKTSSSVLNLALHPHSRSIYAAFMEALYGLKRAVKVRGDRYAILSALDRSEVEAGILSGVLSTFTMVDSSSRWFDLDSLREAEENQTSKIVIPKGLYPNPRSFLFEFDVSKHRLYVQSYTRGDTLSPRSAYKVFAALASTRSILHEFGEAKLSIIQDQAALERLLTLPVIKEIEITILRPNPDILAPDFEQRMAAYFELTNSSSLQLKQRAEQGESIRPDEDLRRLSDYALGSGRVRVRGRDASGAVNESTDDYPQQLNTTYDTEAMSEKSAFRQMVRRRRRQ